MKRLSLLVKCLLLAVLDLGTVFLFFSILDIVQLQIFPYVLLNLLVVLLAVDLAAFLVPHARQQTTDRSWLPFSALTFFYYIVTLVFSSLTCTWIKPSIYLIWCLVFLAAYIAITLSLIFFRDRKGSSWQEKEQIDSATLQQQMIELDAAIRRAQQMLEPRQYDSLCRAYASVRERLAFSTPFGRSPKPVVMDMEKRIADRIANSLKKMRDITLQDAAETAKQVTMSFLDTSELIKNKEKLISG